MQAGGKILAFNFTKKNKSIFDRFILNILMKNSFGSLSYLIKSILSLIFISVYSQMAVSQNTFNITVQPQQISYVCNKKGGNNVSLKCEVQICPFHVPMYSWQRMIPSSLGGNDSFVDIEYFDNQYIGQKTNTLEILNSSTGSVRNFYKYRCAITSIGPAGSNCPPIITAYTNEAEVIGVADKIKMTPCLTMHARCWAASGQAPRPL